jgi:hypothetical protein
MTDSASSRKSPHSGTAAHVRFFTDADGIGWHVREQPFSEYDRRRGRSLIFASESAVRRVRDYPDDWHTLSDEQLSLLSWRS